MIQSPLIFLLSLMLFQSCNNSAQPNKFRGVPGDPEIQKNAEIIDTSGKTIKERFNVPATYKRVEYSPGSFGLWLRQLPLKKHGSPVFLFDGIEKGRQDVHAAVINMDVGQHDLQQCADAVMRLRAEYLFSSKQFSKIHFNFTSGHRCEYVRWAEGYRPQINGSNVTFSRTAAPDNSYANFKKYLKTIFTYAGTLSLSKELKYAMMKDISAGDVFIHGGLPGHAVIVLDVAVNESSGEKVFLLGQSYMPAQEIHVLKNFNNEDFSPWYEAEFSGELETPEWNFSQKELMRF